MRILLVNESARVHTGGIHRMVVESCACLQRAGHEVAVAYYDGGPSEVEGRVFAFPAEDKRSVTGRRFEEILRDFKPDVAQLHLTTQAWFYGGISRLVPTCRFIHDQSPICSGGDRMSRHYAPCHRPHGISCLFWHYAQGCGGKSPGGNWSRWLAVQRRQQLKADTRTRIQVASDFMRRGLLENGYADERIDVVPLFALPPRSEEAVEPGLLLVACRLVKSKGVHVLLAALREFSHVPWNLVVAGTGPEQKALEAMAATYGLNARVRFTGELAPAELEQWYARAQILISPTLRAEPFGLIGPEAMARGKPVVAFAGGATEEWLSDGQTGAVVGEKSAHALGAAIANLLWKPTRCQELGTRARQKWAAYRPSAYVDRAVKSFNRCIAGFQGAG